MREARAFDQEIHLGRLLGFPAESLNTEFYVEGEESSVKAVRQQSPRTLEVALLAWTLGKPQIVMFAFLTATASRLRPNMLSAT